MPCLRVAVTEDFKVTSSSKAKGNAFEREITNAAKDIGLNAVRAYASDGRSLGKSSEVDVMIEGITVQAKRRKKVPDYISIPKDVDVVVVRGDRADALAIIPFEKLLQLIKDGKYV